MPGYVYIMKRNRRDARARATFQAQYKVGISSKVQRRARTVNRAVPGGIRLICQCWAWDPAKVEATLHKDFDSSRHTLRRTRKGAGKTEWFYLNVFEYVFLRWRLFWLCRRVFIFALIAVYLIAAFAAYI